METRSQDFATWISTNIGKFSVLTDTVVSIIKSLLDEQGIEYLSISGRTKDIDGCAEKIKRKAYKNPIVQMTDISGVRVILFFEAQVPVVSQIIRNAFRVDEANSSDTASRMSTNQVGYRSVHFVCDVGDKRGALPEFTRLSGLKFEIQVRTVLQHAWAEMAHDRNYKFRGTLPPMMERKLFLLAGLLETADQGFQDLSRDIDQYRASLVDKTVSVEASGGGIDVISLSVFMDEWADENKIRYSLSSDKIILDDVIRELKEYGIEKIEQIREIIPENYASAMKDVKEMSTPMGVLRDWMVAHDSKRFLKKVKVGWAIGLSGDLTLRKIMDPDEFKYVSRVLIHQADDHWEQDDTQLKLELSGLDEENMDDAEYSEHVDAAELS